MIAIVKPRISALSCWLIAAGEGAPDAGQVEGALDHDRAAGERADFEPDERREGHERVAQHVAARDRTVADALRTGRSHVRCGELGQRLAAHEADPDRQPRQREHHCGEHVAAQPGVRPGDGEEAETDTEPVLADRGHDEQRGCDTEGAEHECTAIEAAPATGRRRRPDRERAGHLDGDGQPDERRRDRQRVEHDVAHRAARGVRITQVAAGEPPQPTRVLAQERLVEVVPPADRRQRALLHLTVPGDRSCWIAGQREGHQEHHHRRREERAERPEAATDDEA